MGLLDPGDPRRRLTLRESIARAYALQRRTPAERAAGLLAARDLTETVPSDATNQRTPQQNLPSIPVASAYRPGRLNRAEAAPESNLDRRERELGGGGPGTPGYGLGDFASQFAHSRGAFGWGKPAGLLADIFPVTGAARGLVAGGDLMREGSPLMGAGIAAASMLPMGRGPVKKELMHLSHFSNARYPVLDPSKAGTGTIVRGAEREAGARGTHFFMEDTPGRYEAFFNRPSQARHDVVGEFALYDLAHDPEGIAASTLSKGKSRKAFEDALTKRGYDGFTRSPDSDFPGSFKQSAVLLRKTQPLPEGLRPPSPRELAKRPDGFTFDPRSGKFYTGKGFAIANPEGAVSATSLEEALHKNAEILRQPGMMLGGWKDPATGKMMYEVSHVVPDRETALALAAQRNEKAVFDLEGMQDVANPHYRDPETPGGASPAVLPPKPPTAPGLLSDQLFDPLESKRAPAEQTLLKLPPGFARGTPPWLQRILTRAGKNYPADIERGVAMGGNNWYPSGGLYDAFVAELGAEEGAKRFKAFADFNAIASPGMRVPKQVQVASHLYQRDTQGLLSPERITTGEANLPEGFRTRYPQETINLTRKYLEQGRELDPILQPKISRFSSSIQGNEANTAIDMHINRGLGMKTAGGVPSDIAPPKAYGEIQGLLSDMGEKQGLTPASAQAAGWVGAGARTGVGPGSAMPFQQVVEQQVAAQAKLLGLSKIETLRKFIRGEIPLGSLGKGALPIFAALLAAEKLKHPAPKE